MNISVNSTQIGGTHYKTRYEHWDFVLLCLKGRYLEGCVSKYVSRWRKKNGLQDLQKAMHYLDKMAELHEAEVYSGIEQDLTPLNSSDMKAMPSDFVELNGLGELESYVILSLCTWRKASHLESIREHLRQLIKEAENEALQLEAVKATSPYRGPPCPAPLYGEGGTSPTMTGAVGEEPGPNYVDQAQDAPNKSDEQNAT